MPNLAGTNVFIKKPRMSKDEFLEMFVGEDGVIRTDKAGPVSPDTYLNFDLTNKKYQMDNDPKYYPKQLIEVTKDFGSDAMFTVNDDVHDAEGKMERTIGVIGQTAWQHLMELGDKGSQAEFDMVLRKFRDKHGDIDYFDGYRGNVEHLGTKGKFDLRDMKFKDDEITFSTETAGSPPREGLQKVADITKSCIVYTYSLEGDGDWEHNSDGDDKCTIDSEEHDYHCDFCEGVEPTHAEVIMPECIKERK